MNIKHIVNESINNYISHIIMEDSEFNYVDNDELNGEYDYNDDDEYDYTTTTNDNEINYNDDEYDDIDHEYDDFLDMIMNNNIE